MTVDWVGKADNSFWTLPFHKWVIGGRTEKKQMKTVFLVYISSIGEDKRFRKSTKVDYKKLHI